MGAGVYAELATGPLTDREPLDKGPLAAINAAFCADVPKTDPGKLAGPSSMASIGSSTPPRGAVATRMCAVATRM
jgi:hypothetical protein